MAIKIIFSFILTSWFSLCSSQVAFNKTAFYSALMNENIKTINEELDLVNSVNNKAAYKGALLMKKSGLLKQTKDKLETFKEGRKTLETAINNDNSNPEYRFLRLIIQENAPKIVNYNAEIKKDASYLRQNYKNLSSELQNLILNYCKKSKELNPQDFKNELHD